MLHALDVLDAVVTKITAIDDAMESIGGADNVWAWTDDSRGEYRSLADALQNMGVPQVLIAHVGSLVAPLGQVPRWRHQFGLWIRSEEQGEAYDFWYNLVRGIPAGDSIPFEELEILRDCCPPSEWQGLYRVTVGADELYHGSFVLVEAGG